MLASFPRAALEQAHIYVARDVLQTFSSRRPAGLMHQKSVKRSYASVATEGGANSEAPHTGQESTLRSTPFAFKHDHSFKINSTNLHQHNLRLASVTKTGDIMSAFDICNAMKRNGVSPDLSTYNWLLESVAHEAMALESAAIVEDMMAMGIKPDETTAVLTMKAHQFATPASVWRLWRWIKEWGLEPNASVYAAFIRRFGTPDYFELVLQCIAEMRAGGIVPELASASHVAILAATRGYPRLALDIVETFEASTTRRVEGEVWMRCLQSSADVLYVDGVLKCWKQVAHGLKMIPDEGLCINILHTAARHGLPDLAADVMHAMTVIGVPVEEHHFASVMEAFCRSGRLRDAFGLLQIMRSSQITPLPTTIRPLYEKIRENIESVESAYALAEKMKKEEEVVDVIVLDVIIRAAIALGDLQRALGVYSSFSQLNISPTVNTLNYLLSGCVAGGHRALGDSLLYELTKEKGVVPNWRTYEQMIFLCLTQDTYEDAFFYLEEMKSADIFPNVEIYQALIKRCVEAQDERYRIALDEMREYKHKVSPSLQRIVDSFGGRPDS